MDIERVLIATRGEIARRLIRFFHDQGIETVIGFSEPEVDLSYIEDADYPVYLNGKTVSETYADPQRVVSAAIDSGCDAIHPGYCFLAERVDFYQLAATANMPVIGCVPTILPAVTSRMNLRNVAAQVGASLIPATDVLPDDEDGIAAGAQLGLPLFVKSVEADVYRRVDRLEDVPNARREVVAEATQQGASSAVYLERVVERMRQVNTTVVADHHGFCVSLGSSESSIQSRYRKWVEEIGPETLEQSLRERIDAWSVAIARKLGWVSVGVVRWAVTPDGGVYLLGMAARLTTGFDLIEELHGIDLLDVQLSTLLGRELTWSKETPAVRNHHLQLRVLHVDPYTGERPEGVVEALSFPDDVRVSLGCEEGQTCSSNTDPLLMKLSVEADTRAQAVALALDAISKVRVDGVATNLIELKRLLVEENFVEGNAVTSSLHMWLASWAVDD